ncbi:hypothetical protein BFW01_g5740 [Lasiodiplodia theobromae]|uniref:Aspergillopepsin-2 n=1 Tax=Lasiodiplodia theobromae TaxID=45133 RepID=A0A5N5CZ42_9PEZI|nr:uncharacterized protein LTHEOB_603 [Lasiodiplodia theobromae]KAB2570659.1 hypothetical protein DBV05_g10663 [Lasiodiplodia theobromae]KAF4540661.1 hypothetical protein LTHEOB_603 [Lasiodiplodia theobromae]KAF9634845.1 hypothetical protein BFW01_g5740 [Lasiodiplodia theobromae]
MRSTSSILPVLALALGAAADQDWHFGDTIYMGPTSGSTYLKKLTYSLVPPAVPTDSSQSDAWLSIWVGISASQSDNSIPLMQPLLNWAPDNAAQGCPADNDAWCVAASTLLPTGQTDEPYVAVPIGSTLDFEIETTSSGTVSQKVSINGEVSSTITNSNIGENPKWVIASNECYSNQCGSLDGYTWANMTITLSAAEESFGDSLSMTGATSDGFTSSDNGLTWTGSIKFNADKWPSS